MTITEILFGRKIPLKELTASQRNEYYNWHRNRKVNKTPRQCRYCPKMYVPRSSRATVCGAKACIDKRLQEASARYYVTDHGQAKIKAYRVSPARRKSARDYANSPKGKLVNARYLATEAGKNCVRRRRQNYRARKRKVFSNNTITMADLSTPCIACGATKQVEGDHRVPLAMGGANRLSNYWPLCKPCNTSKGARLWEEWIAEQGIK